MFSYTSNSLYFAFLLYIQAPNPKKYRYFLLHQPFVSPPWVLDFGIWNLEFRARNLSQRIADGIFYLTTCPCGSYFMTISSSAFDNRINLYISGSFSVSIWSTFNCSNVAYSDFSNTDFTAVGKSS